MQRIDSSEYVEDGGGVRGAEAGVRASGKEKIQEVLPTGNAPAHRHLRMTPSGEGGREEGREGGREGGREEREHSR